MVGRQYTAEQRNFLSMKYQENVGRRNFIQDIIGSFVAKFPMAPVPNKATIKRQNKKQNNFFTVHNLNSKVDFILWDG